MNFNISPIAFYPSRAAQQWRSAFYQRNIAVVTGEDLPPFIINDTPTTAPDTIEIYDPNTDTLINTVSATDILAHTSTVNGVSVNSWIYQGTSAGIWGFSTPGYYYLKIGNYYSDILKFGPVNGDYVKLTYQFFDDIITPDGTLISKYIVYKQIFETDLWHPTYEINEEGKENAGIFYAMQQITKKTCGFSEIVNEAQLDTLNLTRMADNVQIEARTNGVIRNFSTNTFEIKSKWESDDVASIEVTFDLFNIVMKCQQTNVAPEPLPIPVPPPPPSNYIIKGKATGSTVHLKINGTDTALPVTNGEFYYSYDTPLQNIATYNYTQTNDVPILSQRLAGVANITELDCSQSCGFASAALVSFYGMENCTKADFTNCTFASVENINGFLQNAELLTDLRLPDATFANVKMCVMMFLGCKAITNISMPNATITNIQGPIDGLTIIGNASIFSNCRNLKTINMPLCTFEHCTNTGAMFEFCESLETITMPAATFADATDFNTMFAFAHYTGGSFNFGNVFSACTAQPTTINSMFYGANIESVNLSALDAANLTSMSWAFYDSNLHTLTMNASQFANVTNYERCFAGIAIDATTNTLLSTIDFAAATNTKQMFAGLTRYQTTGNVNLAIATFANVTNAESMFEDCQTTSIQMPLATFEKVTNANKMFYNCSTQTEINIPSATFDVVTTANNIFLGCNNLTYLKVPDSSTWPLNFSLAHSPNLTVTYFVAIAKWVKNYSGGTAHSVTFNATAKSDWQLNHAAAYTQGETIFISKNWTY